jgi:hypothetical protein
MFKSKIRPINITQYEHGRLAGAFAAAWGNAAFAKPAIDRDAFVQGVALHDWHYGLADNLPIGEISTTDWLVAVQQGAALRFTNPVTDVVTRLHLKRLISQFESPVLVDLGDQLEAQIIERVSQTQFSRDQFEQADSITRFCDMVAFDFSFEQAGSRTFPVYAGGSTPVPVTYTVTPPGEIIVTPWPFDRSVLSGIIIGYERDGYPDRLQPIIVPYHCRSE